MMNREEALKHLIETYDDFYSRMLNEDKDEPTISMEEFRQMWHKIIDEEYDKLEKELGLK